MKLLSFRSVFAALLTLFAISAAIAKPSPIISTQCTEAAGKNYALDVTVPTGGYELSIVRATARKGVLHITLKYTPPSGVATQALVTRRLRFSLEDIQRPSRYLVTANGKKLGRVKPIESRGLVGID